MTIRDEEKRKKRAAETSQNAIVKNPSGSTASTGATTTSSNIYSGIPTTTEADTVSYGDPVEQANAMLRNHINDKPGAFVFGNQGMLDQAYADYLNREGFTYDMSRDPFYQQYREQYSALGKLAMEDTMGQAASLTGGYGNSYAQTVGQQAYNNYMMQLNNMLPELYSMSRSNYDAEGQQLLNNIALLEGQKQSDYTQHQNEMNDWYNWLNYLQSDARYKEQKALAGSGGGGPIDTGDDWKSQIMNKLWEFKVNEPSIPDDAGADDEYGYSSSAYDDYLQNTVMAYLDDMVEAGYITEAEKTALYNKYVGNQLG